MTDENSPGHIYAIRAAENLADQSKSAYIWLEKIESQMADKWLEELQRTKASLATPPQRCAVAAENRIYQKKYPGPPLRVTLYRHGRNTWRLLFTIHEAEDGDPPYVKLHQLRHSAQRPLTKWPDEE